MRKHDEPSMLSNLLGRLRGTSRPPQSLSQTPRPFQAIAIYRGVKFCAMAKKFSEHRFLAKDAPVLPLSGCTMRETCECRYLKYKDRRAGERRLIDFGSADRGYSGRDRRRQSSGRRTR